MVAPAAIDDEVVEEHEDTESPEETESREETESVELLCFNMNS